jgi:hypothetical protein
MTKHNIVKHDTENCDHLFSCNDNWDCECSSEWGCEECNGEWESEESVAGGLGFIIGDDGHWVPEGY